MKSGYRKLYETGELSGKVEVLKEQLRDCKICPHRCQVNRMEGELGICRTGYYPVVSSYGPHFGEERCLVGKGGSGTVFFSRCVMRCVFCQNYEISQLGEGSEIAPKDLADIMLALEARGCHNINLVSPTHVVPQIAEAVEKAVPKGLTVPLVYNSGGYDEVATLKALEGIVDIYMPDLKFADNEKAKRYTKCKDYFEVAQRAIKEMHRQVGDLKIDEKGLAVKGILVRHLVMPGNLAYSEKVLEFIAGEISRDTVINIMAQYYPTYKAWDYPELARPITKSEYLKVVETAKKLGLRRAIISSW